MNRRQMLATAAGAAASTALPFDLTAEEATAYQDALAHHDVTDIDTHGGMRLWGRLFALPDHGDGSAFPGMCLAPQEYTSYKAHLQRVIALAPDLLEPDHTRHPVEQMDWAVIAFTNALWDAGFRTGMAMEHVRLANLHRALREPELTLK